MILTTPPSLPIEATTRPNLLVVDDQPLNVRLLHQIFQQDYEVFVATTGEEALDICQSQLPDLILLDIVMPVMDGYEVCRRLKENDRTRDIPVIFVTGHNDPSEEERGLEAGAVDFISKSASPKVMRARVKTHITLKHQSDLLRSLTLIDSLTGIANRRHFDEAMATEWRHCMRENLPLSVIMVDIDFFKRYNDHYGHIAGDACLQRVAACINAGFTRAHDLVARYGGEEFICVLPDTPLDGAFAKANYLQHSVRSMRIPHAKSNVEDGVITISLGVATMIPQAGMVFSELILSADRMLYLAKEAGRGQAKATST
ncbi:MAG TPA: diguanylate cyclase [Burkholderiaceae bacterium]|jgi:diguanylate cyclase (GGDEF)-like protein|nr:diguanylate cyclase [Burkholderiaceae bacterium]